MFPVFFNFYIMNINYMRNCSSYTKISAIFASMEKSFLCWAVFFIAILPLSNIIKTYIYLNYYFLFLLFETPFYFLFLSLLNLEIEAFKKSKIFHSLIRLWKANKQKRK